MLRLNWIIILNMIFSEDWLPPIRSWPVGMLFRMTLQTLASDTSYLIASHKPYFNTPPLPAETGLDALELSCCNAAIAVRRRSF
jgi:hypothetical protein